MQVVSVCTRMSPPDKTNHTPHEKEQLQNHLHIIKVCCNLKNVKFRGGKGVFRLHSVIVSCIRINLQLKINH